MLFNCTFFPNGVRQEVAISKHPLAKGIVIINIIQSIPAITHSNAKTNPPKKSQIIFNNVFILFSFLNIKLSLNIITSYVKYYITFICKKRHTYVCLNKLNGGSDEGRTRDLMRDRHAL